MTSNDKSRPLVVNEFGQGQPGRRERDEIVAALAASPLFSEERSSEAAAIIAQIGRGEYRLEGEHIVRFNPRASSVVRRILASAKHLGEEGIGTHYSLTTDLGLSVDELRRLSSRFESETGVVLSTDELRGMCVWDVLSAVNDQFTRKHIESLITQVKERLLAGQELNQALAMAQRARALTVAGTGEESDLYVSCLYRLGIAYTVAGDVENGLECLREALDVGSRVLGERDLLVASTLHNLGTALDRAGAYAEAEERFRQAIDICDEHFGGGDPDTAMMKKNLASMLQRVGRVEEAEILMRECLATAERGLGTEHRQTTTTLAGLAGILAERGQLEEAGRMMRRALASCRRLFAPSSVVVTAVENNLSVILARQNRLEEALELARSALESVIVLCGASDPWTIAIQNNIALMKERLGHESGHLEWEAAVAAAKGLPETSPIRQAVLGGRLVSLPIAA